MTKRELFENLKHVPDYAEVFVWADHGQQDSKVHYVEISSTPEKYWDDELDWRGNKKAITAVRIS